LAARGRRAARQMGRRLAKRKAHPSLMLSSPAVRALKTARIMARKLHYPSRRIAVDAGLYACTMAELLRAVQALDKRHSRVMLFGHNPEMTGLARHFSRETPLLRTCAVARFTFKVDAWADVGPDTLAGVEFEFPKKDRK
jgi:phosphohistidine phosphatase